MTANIRAMLNGERLLTEVDLFAHHPLPASMTGFDLRQCRNNSPFDEHRRRASPLDTQDAAVRNHLITVDNIEQQLAKDKNELSQSRLRSDRKGRLERDVPLRENSLARALAALTDSRNARRPARTAYRDFMIWWAHQRLSEVDEPTATARKLHSEQVAAREQQARKESSSETGKKRSADDSNDSDEPRGPKAKKARKDVSPARPPVRDRVRATRATKQAALRAQESGERVRTRAAATKAAAIEAAALEEGKKGRRTKRKQPDDAADGEEHEAKKARLTGKTQKIDKGKAAGAKNSKKPAVAKKGKTAAAKKSTTRSGAKGDKVVDVESEDEGPITSKDKAAASKNSRTRSDADNGKAAGSKSGGESLVAKQGEKRTRDDEEKPDNEGTPDADGHKAKKARADKGEEEQQGQGEDNHDADKPGKGAPSGPKVRANPYAPSDHEDEDGGAGRGDQQGGGISAGEARTDDADAVNSVDQQTTGGQAVTVGEAKANDGQELKERADAAVTAGDKPIIDPPAGQIANPNGDDQSKDQQDVEKLEAGQNGENVAADQDGEDVEAGRELEKRADAAAADGAKSAVDLPAGQPGSSDGDDQSKDKQDGEKSEAGQAGEQVEAEAGRDGEEVEAGQDGEEVEAPQGGEQSALEQEAEDSGDELDDEESSDDVDPIDIEPSGLANTQGAACYANSAIQFLNTVLTDTQIAKLAGTETINLFGSDEMNNTRTVGIRKLTLVAKAILSARDQTEKKKIPVAPYFGRLLKMLRKPGDLQLGASMQTWLPQLVLAYGHPQSVLKRPRPKKGEAWAGVHQEDWAGLKQQDSHEYLSVLLDALAEEHKFMRHILATHPISSIECGSCGHRTVTPGVEKVVEIPYLPEELPETVGKKANKKGRKSKKKDEKPRQEDKKSISQLLNAMQTNEDLPGYRCDNCGDDKASSRSTRLSHAPKYIAVHLNRTDPADNIKSHRRVDLSELDEITTPISDDVYEVQAIVQHLGGSSNFGHYTTWRRWENPRQKNPQPWHLIDDEKVTHGMKSKDLDVLEQQCVMVLLHRLDS